MNTEFLNSVNQELIKALKAKYHLDDAKVLALSEAGRASLINSLKQFVIKNGTPEIEDILLNRKGFDGSPLQALSFSNFQKDIADKQLLDNFNINEVASFSINYLIERFKTGFKNSGYSKDLDGICLFLEIDKKIIKLANSPVAKILGKFF